MWFLICGLIQVLLLSLVVNFYCFNSHFPVTTLGLDLFSGTYLNRLTVSMVPSDRVSQPMGPTGLGASLPEDGNRGGFRNIVLL
jgi:hypothetical protein